MGQVAYSIAEAAATTATTEATITTEIREGRLRAREVGLHKIILHSDLAAWAEGLPEISRSRPVKATRLVSVAT